MYQIEKTYFGLRLTFADIISGEEMARWVEEFSAEVDKINGDFAVFIDMRTLEILSKYAQDNMRKGQTAAREGGMLRSVVILSNPKIKLLFVNIAKKTGIFEWERYIDASTEPDWEEKGMQWILNAVDPDTGKRHERDQKILSGF
ncbi:MAG: hypothetical protein U9N55_04325 [candidate division Zixibacteria bacterium]|nr:hypothetical protein [candidate division Zixibacteria bacterium]